MVDYKNSLEINEDGPNLQVANLNKMSQPRTKHDTICSCDDEDDVGEQRSDEDTDNEGDSDTGEWLRDQFN